VGAIKAPEAPAAGTPASRCGFKEVLCQYLLPNTSKDLVSSSSFGSKDVLEIWQK